MKTESGRPSDWRFTWPWYVGRLQQTDYQPCLTMLASWQGTGPRSPWREVCQSSSSRPWCWRQRWRTAVSLVPAPCTSSIALVSWL